MSIPALSRYPVYLCQLLKRDKHGYILWGGLLAPYLSLSRIIAACPSIISVLRLHMYPGVG